MWWRALPPNPAPGEIGGVLGQVLRNVPMSGGDSIEEVNMSWRREWFWLAVFIGCLIARSGVGMAQEGDDEVLEVSIERVALDLNSPDRYRIPLELSAVRDVWISAPTEGIVSQVIAGLGKSVNAQGELLRLESQERQLLQRQAEAALEAARLEAEAADGPAKAAAEARVKMAQRGLELAEFRVSQAILRSPLNGLVTEILVTEGEYVRPGQRVARAIDPSRLYVHLPIERSEVEAGGRIGITVEDQRAEGTVEAILPAEERFLPLRELFLSVATARVVLDNSSGRLQPGQAVYSEMIPRHPVAEIPTAALRNMNGDEGERKVQVLREGFVRDLPVQVLGQIGETHVFVSARFTPQDELIVSSSIDLGDGSWIRPMLEIPEKTDKPASERRTPAPQRSGF
jgi:multidrug efflux pump subunit AcrA (membrane-fusion protein)